MNLVGISRQFKEIYSSFKTLGFCTKGWMSSEKIPNSHTTLKDVDQWFGSLSRHFGLFIQMFFFPTVSLLQSKHNGLYIFRCSIITS